MPMSPEQSNYYSKLQSMSKQSKLLVAGSGLTKTEQALLAAEAGAAENPAVASYVASMYAYVKDYQGNAVDLKKVLPLINGVVVFSANDKSLTPEEHTRINYHANYLRGFVNQKTSLFTKATSTLKNVAKSSLSKAVGGAASKLGESESFLVRMAGKALGAGHRAATREPTGPSAASKDALQAQADIIQAQLERLAAPEEEKPIKVRKAKKEKAPATGKVLNESEAGLEKLFGIEFDKSAGGARGGRSTDILQLSILEQILEQVHGTNVLLGKANETAEDEKEARERADKAALPGNTPLRAKKAKGKDENAGILDWFKNLGIAGIELSGIGTIFKDMVKGAKLLGEGALIAGFAIMGWKVGDWIDQLLGLGSASENLAKLFDFSGQSFGDTIKSIEKTLLDLATTGKTPEQNQIEKTKKETIEKAQAAGMMSNLTYHEGWDNGDLYREAVAFNNTHRKQDISLSHEDVTQPRGFEMLSQPSSPYMEGGFRCT